MRSRWGQRQKSFRLCCRAERPRLCRFALFPGPRLIFVARLAERVTRVFCFHDPLLRIDTYDRRSKDEFPFLNPLMAESPAYQEISWAQCLIAP